MILSVELYHALKHKLDENERAERKMRFESEFGQWIAAQNARVESQGIPGADLRPW